MNAVLVSRQKRLSLASPVVMGILNVTPDSFSDGGEFLSVHKAVDRALAMIAEGAKIIDIGGESSGPGSIDVSLEEELSRVIPLIKAIRAYDNDIWLSVDTYKSEVAREAIMAGADMVNDVTATRADQKIIEVVKEFDVPLVIMYSKDVKARTTTEAREYGDVIKEIKHFLLQRIEVLRAAGVKDEQIIVDPGMGAFVSSIPSYSFEIIQRLAELQELGYPILVGPSRKSFLGGNLEDRLPASVLAAKSCVQNGAKIVRVHDVKETVEALQG